MQVVDGDVRQVMLSLARLGNLSLVMDADVAGTVTVNMTAEPESILRLVAASKGFALVQTEGGLLVTTEEKARRFRRAYVYPVHYADPNELARAAKLSLWGEGNQGEATNSKAKSGAKEDAGSVARPAAEDEDRVRVDTATNSILLFGTPSEAHEVERIVHALDVPGKQVSLEAKVVALSRDAQKKLGVDWSWYGKDRAPGTIRFGHAPEARPFSLYYEAELQALVTDGKASVLARPNITTMQGHEAVISIGGEVPVPMRTVADSVTTTTYAYKKAGIILRYLPRVDADGTITARVHTEVSSPYYVEDMKAYRFQERSADTTVRLADGETMVIGGLIGKEETRAASKIPLLGDIPILGAFFRSVRTQRTASEVMIFLTAHVVDMD